MVVGNTRRRSALEGIAHRMLSPIHLFVWIFPLELHAVTVADMLHVGCVGAQNPRVDGRFATEHLHFEYQLLVRVLEVWKRVMGLNTIISPQNSVLLYHRELEESRRRGHWILARHPGTSSVCAVPPVMERAPDLSIDELAN